MASSVKVDPPLPRRLRDVLLVGVALAVLAGFGWTLWREFTTGGWDHLSGAGDIALAVAILTGYAVGVAWIALGCWRRTSWGFVSDRGRRGDL